MSTCSRSPPERAISLPIFRRPSIRTRSCCPPGIPWALWPAPLSPHDVSVLTRACSGCFFTFCLHVLRDPPLLFGSPVSGPHVFPYSRVKATSNLSTLEKAMFIKTAHSTSLLATCALLGTSTLAQADFPGFDDLPLGSSFAAGDSTTSEGVEIAFAGMPWLPSGPDAARPMSTCPTSATISIDSISKT